MKLAKLIIPVLAIIVMVSCATAPESAVDRADLEKDAGNTVDRFKGIDPNLNKRFVETAKGYAVFPEISKGAVGVGGAGGHGVLYEGGRIVGYCHMSQGSIGFQLGGQVYSEIIFFETKDTLDHFKQGNMEFDAQVSAVAASADASANAKYDNGVKVFTLAAKGLMYEASVGGQSFSYVQK